MSLWRVLIQGSHTDNYLQLETQIPSVMAESLVEHWRLNLPVQVLGLMQNIHKTKRKKLKNCTICCT